MYFTCMHIPLPWLVMEASHLLPQSMQEACATEATRPEHMSSAHKLVLASSFLPLPTHDFFFVCLFLFPVFSLLFILYLSIFHTLSLHFILVKFMVIFLFTPQCPDKGRFLLLLACRWYLHHSLGQAVVCLPFSLALFSLTSPDPHHPPTKCCGRVVNIPASYSGVDLISTWTGRMGSLGMLRVATQFLLHNRTDQNRTAKMYVFI
jgi:hypothetical protein